jgi:hypothetical protein
LETAVSWDWASMTQHATDEPAIQPDPGADTPPPGDKGAGAPADDDTPDPDEYADPDAPSR